MFSELWSWIINFHSCPLPFSDSLLLTAEGCYSLWMFHSSNLMLGGKVFTRYRRAHCMSSFWLRTLSMYRDVRPKHWLWQEPPCHGITWSVSTITWAWTIRCYYLELQQIQGVLEEGSLFCSHSESCLPWITGDRGAWFGDCSLILYVLNDGAPLWSSLLQST